MPLETVEIRTFTNTQHQRLERPWLKGQEQDPKSVQACCKMLTSLNKAKEDRSGLNYQRRAPRLGLF